MAHSFAGGHDEAPSEEALEAAASWALEDLEGSN